MGDSNGRNGVVVILPAYFGAGIVPRAIRSVLAQDHRPLDLLVIDDGSRDGTADAALAAIGNDPRGRVERNPSNQGIAATLNRGLAESQAPFVLTLHQDCEILEADAVSRAVEEIEMTSRAGLVGRSVHRVADMDRWERRFWVLRNHSAFATTAGDDAFDDPLFSENKCDLFRRTALAAVGGFDEGFRFGGEDQKLAWELTRRGLFLGPSESLRYSITLAQRTGVGDHLRKERSYGLQMRTVLRRTRFGNVRRTAHGKLDPRLINRASAVAWPLAFLALLIAGLVTGSLPVAALSVVPPLLRVAQLVLRLYRYRAAYGFRARDLLLAGPLGLAADLAYGIGLVSPAPRWAKTTKN